MTFQEKLICQNKLNYLDNLLYIDEQTMRETKDEDTYREAETSWRALNNQMNILRDLFEDLGIPAEWNKEHGWEIVKCDYTGGEECPF